MTNTPITPVVEMKIGGVWVDVTDDVRLNDADSGGGVRIKRGVPDEGNSAEPTEVEFVLNNAEGKYSPKNPYSIYYGQLGRNTPVRFALSRQRDTFARTEADSWGRLPSWTNTELATVLGERWALTGAATRFDVTPGAATIVSGTGYSLATFGVYADVEIKCKVKVSNLTSEFGVVVRNQDVRINPDGDFESGIGTWVASASSTLVASTAQFHTGTTSALLTVSGSPTAVSVRGTRMAATPGHSYRARMWVRCSVSRTVTATIDWLDSTGAYLSSATNGVAVTANTWTVLEVDGTAPDAAAYVTHGPQLNSSPTNGTLLFVDDVELLDNSTVAYYAVYVVPGAPDQVRFTTVAPGGVSISSSGNSPIANVVAGDYYWLRVQATGIRRRAKFWKDGSDEPRDWSSGRVYEDKAATVTSARPPASGQVGLYAKDGSATVTFSEVEVNVWRAHAEIASMPPKWDLSRQDRWVPVSARGILQRLGQGRKALYSAVMLHLQNYTTTKMWIPLEQLDAADGYAGNYVQNGPSAIATDVEQGSIDTAGDFTAPGLSGCMTLDQDTSFLSARAISGATPGVWSFLTFLRIPGTTASDAEAYRVESTGTARTFRMTYNATAAMRVDCLAADGTVLSTSGANMYFSAHPQGCWLAANLYVFDSGGTVTWAWNFHKPGGTGFYSINGSFSGSAGAFVGAKAQGSAALTAAGGIQFAHWFHYPGDLPFVTSDFARAAYGYIGEGAVTRALRLISNAGEKGTTTGRSSIAKTMGPQVPSQLLDLLDDCVSVDDAILMEERDDFGLSVRTRESMYNQIALELDIDLGHLAQPLDPTPDDQRTRNSVTVIRPAGGFARAVQIEGPLNVNNPEDDPDGVGTYDEAPEINFEKDGQLQAAANWRKNQGVVVDERYPSITCDLTHSAYEADPHLSAQVLSKDSGDTIGILNPEVSYDRNEQWIQGYTEFIDQYDHAITFVGNPAKLYQVGVVEQTTRLATRYITLNGSFAAGTDSRMSTEVATGGSLWVQVKDSPQSFPFEIEVEGCRLNVHAVGNVLNTNPYFEEGISGYSVSGTTTLYWDRYPNQYKSGVGSLRMTATGATTGGAVATASAPVTAGTDYQISAWLMTNVVLTDVSVAIDWYQANGTFISTSLPTPVATVGYVWQHFAATVTAPALAAGGRIRPRAVLANTNILWADDLRLMPVSSYSASPQMLSVDQAPTNGVTKTLSDGASVSVVQPWQVAF